MVVGLAVVEVVVVCSGFSPEGLSLPSSNTKIQFIVGKSFLSPFCCTNELVSSSMFK